MWTGFRLLHLIEQYQILKIKCNKNKFKEFQAEFKTYNMAKNFFRWLLCVK